MPRRCCLLIAFWLTSHGALAADREWFTLTIDGNRVGYAWHYREQQSGHLIDSEATRMDVTELRKTVAVETRNEIASKRGRTYPCE